MSCHESYNLIGNNLLGRESQGNSDKNEKLGVFVWLNKGFNFSFILKRLI